MFPRGAEGVFTFVLKRNEDYRFLKWYLSHPHSKGKQTHASNTLMFGFSSLYKMTLTALQQMCL